MAFISPIVAISSPSISLTSTSSRRSGRPRLRSTSFLRNRIKLRPPSCPQPLHPSPSPVRMSSPTPKILISGAPASGKGTQCEFIVKSYSVVHISTGDMLRAAVKAATPLGNEAKAFMDAGELVPDHLVIAMLKERISQPDCLEHGWLLDGFPRTSVQALALDDAGIHPAAVILLDVPDDVLIQRVVGRRLDPVTGNIYHNTFSPPTDPEVATRLIQRSDDTEEKARLRLSTYYSHTQSIQAHYSAVLKKVDGNRNKTQVFTDLSQIIDASLASDHDDTPTSTPSAPSSSDSTPSSDVTESTKSVPVAEFVRRAEEAYEKGVLLENDVNWSGQATAESSQDSGTSNYYDLFRRLDLVIGDLIAFLSFAYIGRIVHGQPAIDLDLFKTAAPFCIAWLLASPLLGVYTRGATANISTAIKTFSKSWAVAVPMGIGLHGVVTDHIPPATFAIISLLSTYVLIGSWRVLYVKIRGDETMASRRGGVLDGLKMVTTLLRRW